MTDQLPAAILDANLRALSARQPALAEVLARTAPDACVEFRVADDGGLAAVRDGRSLASLRRPRAEAERWAAAVNLEQAGAFVVMGFGLGHHVHALASRLGRHGIVIAFEPDLGLLRAVFERIDCSSWLSGVLIAHEVLNAAALAASVRGLEALVALGVSLLEHPPSRGRLEAPFQEFSGTVAQLVRATRTQVATSLVHAHTTLRNLLMNVDRYVSAPGIADLEGAASGRAAVVVSAGPSLARNIELLAEPGVRDRVVIIAVQTVLKALLARGIRPHFVTALDHHEISARFYEGLTPADVEGVQLVAEPKVNAAVTGAFPGVIRLAADVRLDQFLGADLARPMGAIEPGATVAHLAYAFARRLGCDPVILIGQDLGFTLGQYYAAGASIHQVWAGELNAFRTLEMMEWERIARGKALLTPALDQRGRPAFTDEQMHSYLVQFERMFAEDESRGLSTLDATEGGVRKQHTRIVTLREALDSAPAGPALAFAPPPGEAGREEALRERLAMVEAQAERIGVLCRGTLELLEQVRTAPGDRADALLRRIDKAREEVFTLEPAFGLVQFLSQNAALNRYRADRLLALAGALEPAERRRRQVERDIGNVRWLGEAADSLVELLHASVATLNGAPKLTRDPDDSSEACFGSAAPGPAGSSIPKVVVRPARRLAAIVWTDPECGTLGVPRSLDHPGAPTGNFLRATLARLAQVPSLGRVVLLCDDPERVRALAGVPPQGLMVDVVQRARPGVPMPSAAVRQARRWGSDCWRGAIADLTCYDEVFDPAETLQAMEVAGLDAALLLGADWSLIDPALTEEIIRRHASAPDRHRLVFSQAPPGLAPCLIERSLAAELARQSPVAGPLASLGALLGYLPAAPRPDPIAKHTCLTIDPALRDMHARFIGDTAHAQTALAAALAEHGLQAPALALAAVAIDALDAVDDRAPRSIVLELCTGRLTSGVRSSWRRGMFDAPERRPMDLQRLASLLREAAKARQDLCVTLAGAGDPLHHPGWRDAIALAREAGVLGVHLRTDALADRAVIASLLEAPLEAVSIDLLANSRTTYARLAGIDAFARAHEHTALLAEAWRHRVLAGGHVPWIVPRITKCDAVVGEFEDFYDFWLSRTGACVIDALPRVIENEDIRPLPLPSIAERRLSGAELVILSDGSAAFGPSRLAGNVLDEGISAVWRRIRRARGRMERARVIDRRLAREAQASVA